VTAARSAADLHAVSWITDHKLIRLPFVTPKFAIHTETPWRQVARASGRRGYIKSSVAAPVPQIRAWPVVKWTTAFNSLIRFFTYLSADLPAPSKKEHVY
jgi:hypothetical protein